MGSIFKTVFQKVELGLQLVLVGLNVVSKKSLSIILKQLDQTSKLLPRSDLDCAAIFGFRLHLTASSP